MKFVNYLLLLVALPLAFCTEKKNKTEQPLTREEAIAFAKKIETSAENRQRHVFDSLICLDEFSKRVIGSEIKKNEKEMMAGISKALEKGHLGREIVSGMGEYGTYRFLHHYEKDNKHHVIFRLYGDGGINYHDMELIKMEDRVMAADMLVYTTGENFSKTAASLITTMLGYADKSGDNATTKQANNMTKMRSLIDQKRFTEARAMFENFPETFKREKVFRLMYISILSEIDMEEYKREILAFENDYSNDPTAQLSLLDGYFVKGEMEKALKAIDVIDKGVKGDPLLNYYRALIHTQMGNDDKTIEYLELLNKEVPDFGDGQLELIANYVEAGKTSEANTMVAVYKKNKKFDQSKLETLRYAYPTLVVD